MDKLFDSYWVLRVTALVLAFLLFFYVKALTDDAESTSSNAQMDIITDVPLEVYYDTDNLIVSGLPETVDVKISGPTPIVIETKLKKDFKVFVDLNSLLIGEHRVTIQQENFSEKLEVSIDPKTVDVVIEEKVTKELRVDPDMSNGQIADGFELIGMTPEPNTVFVTGAKSVIENISYVKATVTGEDGINSSFKQEANVKVLDNNLNKLDVTIEPETVIVNVDIKEYSREIPLSIRQTGRPGQGITVNNISSDTDSIVVYGPKSIIDSLTELVVEFDISEIEESGVYEVNLEIPNGATKLSSKTIEIEADITREETAETSAGGTTEAENTEQTDTEEINTEQSTTEENTTE